MSKSPSEYRAERRATVTTPGGLEVHLRKFNPVDILIKFDLQPALIARVRAAQAAGEKLSDLGPEIIAENYKDLYALSCAFICAAAVSPRITMEPTEDEDAVCVRELDPEDIEALMSPVMGWLGLKKEALQIVAPFRDEGDDPGEGETVGSATQLADVGP